jgi:hypothetical protein
MGQRSPDELPPDEPEFCCGNCAWEVSDVDACTAWWITGAWTGGGGSTVHVLVAGRGPNNVSRERFDFDF